MVSFVRRHRSAVAVGLILLAITAIIVITIRASQDGSPSRERGAPPTTAPALTGAAAELVRLLEAGKQLAFDGRYSVSSAGRPPGTLRLWSRPPLLRADTESGSGRDLRRNAQFSLPSGPVSCTRQADGPWTCKSEPGLPIGLGLLPEPFVAQLPGVSVQARADRIGGREARCFALTGPAAPAGDVCLSPDGILLRVQAGSTTMELVELDRAAPPEEIFEPPAPVS